MTTSKQDGALSRLKEAAHAGRSGELVCVGKRSEVHVFLQRGRVAWGTDSAHPYEFARYLREQCNIDESTFREVIEECRKSQLPLGQTLIEWRLATSEDVREALRHQVMLVLRSLESDGAGNALFLERPRFGEYDERLTFDLDELIAENPMEEPSPKPPATVERITLPPISTEIRTTANQLLGTASGALWVEIHERGEMVERAPAADAVRRVQSSVVAASLAAGADFLAVRGEATFVGTRLPHSARDAFFLLGAGTSFGAFFASLLTMKMVRKSIRPEKSTLMPRSIGWQVGEASGRAAIERVLHTSKEAVAVIVTRGSTISFGAGRELYPLSECEGLLSSRTSLFQDARRQLVSGRADTNEEKPISLVTGEERTWCYGAELDTEGAVVWMLAPRWTSQGLGWSSLANLTRVLRQGSAAA